MQLRMVLKTAGEKYIVIIDDDAEVVDNNWIDRLSRHFESRNKLGYASGNVLAKSTSTKVQKIWENKGGLSKGPEFKYFSQESFREFKLNPLPLSKIFAGCNSMILRDAVVEVGGYSYFFNHGDKQTLGHGDSLEFGYRLIRAGYEMAYDPEATVLHNHPSEEKVLKNKLFYYGQGDSGLHLYLFLKYLDFRCLYWACGGHQLYTFKNLLKSIKGSYKLPPSYVLYSLIGSMVGPWMFLAKYYFFKRNSYSDYETNIFDNNK